MSAINTPDRYREVQEHMARGNGEAALAAVMRLQQENPADAMAHFLRGRIALETGDHRLAKSCFEHAVALHPGQADHHAFLGYCHVTLGDRDAATRSAESALALDPGERTLDLIANIWEKLGNCRRSMEALRRAAEGSSISAIHFNLGTQLKFSGDFAAAQSAIRRAIELDPNNVQARAALSELRTASRDDNQIEELEALLARAGHPAQRLYIAHALASEYEALGDYERAFHAFESGKGPLRAHLGCNVSGDKALFDAMHRAFDRDYPIRGYTEARPIFVVGMPRSGTTVVDRMLSLHPNVQSVGETMLISKLLQEITGSKSAHLLDPGHVPALIARGDLSKVGRSFMERLMVKPEMAGRLLVRECPRPLDKLPLNSLLSGFIIKALPNARAVCVVRGAMDTIVGNYRQLLEFESPIYRYNLSLESCARYYVEFRRLVDLWSSRFPERFIAIRYEEIVADPERVSRAMFDFCGLSWDPGVTKIETNQAPVATASAIQVREPLNARGVGRWRRYERFIGPALSVLAEAEIEP